jgi:hypothetical protein
LGILTDRAYLSLHLRVLFKDAALRMIGAHPLFGVGPGRYALEFPAFASSELLQYYDRAAAHDNVLWIAAEFGLVGVAAFLWFLVEAAKRVWVRLREDPLDLPFLGLTLALGAFVMTWVSWQPLEVPVVAYTFWVLLGVAASHADGGHKAPDRPEEGTRTRRFWRRAVVAFVVLVVISVPIRARQAIGDIDFSRVAYGFHLWEAEGPGTRYRWTGSRATFFVHSSARAIDLPLRAFDPASLETEAFEVRILVNRRRVGLARLTDDKWHRVRVPAPRHAEDESFWRVDLEVNPTWRPVERLPASTDSRMLGVKVGEIHLEETPGPPAP